MSKPLSSFPEHMRETVARRRASNQTRGNGFNAALDYGRRKGLNLNPTPRTKKKVDDVLVDAMLEMGGTVSIPKSKHNFKPGEKIKLKRGK